MTAFTEFARLPYDVQLRAKADACLAYKVPWFYDLDVQVRRAVMEQAAATYYALHNPR